MSHNKGQYTFGQLVAIVEDLKLMLEKLRKEFDDHKENFDVHIRNTEPEDQCTPNPADIPDNSKQKNATVNSRMSLEGVHIKLENDVETYPASPAVSSKKNTRRDISSRDVSGGAKQNFDIQRDLLKIEKDLLESVGEEVNCVNKRRSNKGSGRKRKSDHNLDNDYDGDGGNLLAIEMNNYAVGDDDDAELNHGSLLAIKAEPKLEPEEKVTKIQKLKKIKSVKNGKNKKKVDKKSGSESAINSKHKVSNFRELDKSIMEENGRRKRRHPKNPVKYNSFDMDESDVDDEATNNENTEEEDVEEEEDQGKEPKKLYCKCRGPATKDDMIGCDGPCQVGVTLVVGLVKGTGFHIYYCQDWFHFECVGIPDTFRSIAGWWCETCFLAETGGSVELCVCGQWFQPWHELVRCKGRWVVHLFLPFHNCVILYQMWEVPPPWVPGPGHRGDGHTVGGGGGNMWPV